MRKGPTSGKIASASVKKAIDRCQNYVEDCERGYADEILLRGMRYKLQVWRREIEWLY